MKSLILRHWMKDVNKRWVSWTRGCDLRIFIWNVYNIYPNAIPIIENFNVWDMKWVNFSFSLLHYTIRSVVMCQWIISSGPKTLALSLSLLKYHLSVFVSIESNNTQKKKRSASANSMKIKYLKKKKRIRYKGFLCNKLMTLTCWSTSRKRELNDGGKKLNKLIRFNCFVIYSFTSHIYIRYAYHFYVNFFSS